MSCSWAVGATRWTPSMRPSMALARVGSSASWLWSDWPLVTVSRLVPSRSIWASRSAWLERVMPSTETIAAMPIAMPSADSPARSGRARRPTVPTGRRSAGRNRDLGVAGDALRTRPMGTAFRSGVGHDMPVAQLDLAGHGGGDQGVVGDHYQGDALPVELLQQRHHRAGGGRVEVAGGLVGQHHLRLAGQRPGDRHPLALPTRQRGGALAQPVAEPDPLQRQACQPPPLGAAQATVQQTGGDIVQRTGVLQQEELLEDHAEAMGAQARKPPVRQRPKRLAGQPHHPAGGPVQRRYQVQQGGLAGPRRPYHRDQFPVGDGKGDAAHRFHRRATRIGLANPVELQDRRGRRRERGRRCCCGGGHGAGTSTLAPSASPAPASSTSPAVSSNSPVRTTIRRWVAPSTSSTAYPPPGWASSALIGTASTPLSDWVVMATCTGAWSRWAAVRGSASPTVTGTVACPAPLPLPPWPWSWPLWSWPPWPLPLPGCTATRPTVVTVPGVVASSGSVTSTRSPRRTSCCMAGSNATLTTGRVEVAVRIAVPAGSGAPTVAVTVATRIGPGQNTTCPSATTPVRARPLACCQRLTAAAVARL